MNSISILFWVIALAAFAALAVVAVIFLLKSTRSPVLTLGIVAGLGLCITAIWYGTTTGRPWLKAWQLRRDLRAAYPFKSMVDRVPEPKQDSDQPGMSQLAAAELSGLEDKLAELPQSQVEWFRHIHEDHVGGFIQSPGFGRYRTVADRLGGPGGSSIEQPGKTSSETPPANQPIQAVREALAEAHLGNVVVFANPNSFGYVKDREHVAGFESHRIGYRDQITQPYDWRVKRVELVGLLLQDEPIVYLSEKLPRMDEMRNGPTRKLDAFEEAALNMLRRGEGLAVGETTDGLRMLGALRAAKQCVSCHGGKRGDLLGAFSYTLRPAEKKD